MRRYMTLSMISLIASALVGYQDKAKYDVPFAFQVGKASLPAGTYTVSKIADHSIVIRNRQQAGQAALMNYRDRESKPQSPKLVFHKHGQRYFLAEAWVGGRTGMQLPESEREKE